MIGGRMIRQLLVAAFLMSLLPTRADAVMSAPMPFEMPVPEGWRAPLERLLRDLEISDPASTVAASKAGPFHDTVNGPDMMIFRIVHAETCTPDQDECLTIIAHIEKDELVSDAMFTAGGKTNGGDVLRRVGGRTSVPLFFYSRDKTVSVTITGRGLFVSSGPAVEWSK